MKPIDHKLTDFYKNSTKCAITLCGKRINRKASHTFNGWFTPSDDEVTCPACLALMKQSSSVTDNNT